MPPRGKLGSSPVTWADLEKYSVVLDGSGRVPVIQSRVRSVNGKTGAVDVTAEASVTAPLTGDGSPGSPIAIPKATALVDGYLGALDFAAFDAKQNALGYTPVPNTRTVNGHELSADVTVSKSDVGLGNCDNTSDANKPVSTATATALGGKVDTTTTVNGHALSANVTVSKSDVGLGSVPNTDCTTTANITDSTNKRFVTDAQLTSIGTALQSVTVDSPLTGSGTSASHLSMPAATDSVNGYLTSADHATFNGKQSALGFTPENVANKDTSTSLGTSNTKYPSQNAVKVYADTKLATVTADSPLSGSGTSGSHLVIANAAADGSTKGAAAFNPTDFTASSGVISSTGKYLIPCSVPSASAVTWTTTVANIAAVNNLMTIPRTGSYKFRFHVKIVTVSGTPSTITFRTNGSTALSRCPANSGSGSFATLIAANTVVATLSKGSTWAAGDCYYGDSSAVSLTAGDTILCGTANTQLFTAAVNNATNVTAIINVFLVEQ